MRTAWEFVIVDEVSGGGVCRRETRGARLRFSRFGGVTGQPCEDVRIGGRTKP